MNRISKRKPVPTSPEISRYNESDEYVRRGSYQSIPLADRSFMTEESFTPSWQPHQPPTARNNPSTASQTMPESAISGLSDVGSNHPLQVKVRTAKWGVNWFKKPLVMPIFALAGLGMAIGHHFYFQSLDGHLAPDDGVYSQQVAKQVGNAFVVLALACFRASIVIAYNQYIWTIFRRNSLKVSTIDNLFSLPSRLLSFFSWQLLSKAPLAVVLGAVPWYVQRMLPQIVHD